MKWRVQASSSEGKWRREVIGLLGLTACTGVLDAVSYLALDGVFTGNMTGNVLVVGFSLGGSQGSTLISGVTVLLTFVLGAFASGSALRAAKNAQRCAYRQLLLGGVLMAIAGVVMLMTTRSQYLDMAFAATLAVVMGVQGAAVRTLGNKNITTIVVTSTLVRLGAEGMAAVLRKPRDFAEQLGAVLAMGIGALVGAVSVQHILPGITVLITGLVYLFVTVFLKKVFILPKQTGGV
ncbi:MULTISPECIES: YoaK family protein [unclassified Pseudoclavibacter]|uniref:YoaK family protein n=1 Tax=unclassified Pseudoclavibacter TaxID=2615177 RepID=UPI001301537C|nr:MULTISPECIES: YoaK family protein [unclassified Pseudoclavibacter]KAB1659172.1 DUF1275 domain-containing protein [Pseudoclavibacter sp. CFCC 11306]KAB1660831.1 DUF1275 domain-containing protein [Pseudoclavibacter sp. CFCC 13796]